MKTTTSIIAVFVSLLCTSSLMAETNSCFRTWTAKDGKKIVGRLVSCKNDMLTLQNEENTFKVKFSAVSSDDQRYVVNIGNPYYGITAEDVKKRHAWACEAADQQNPQAKKIEFEMEKTDKLIREGNALLERVKLESLSDNPRIGDVRRLQTGSVIIDQIVSTNSALVSYKYGEIRKTQVLLIGLNTYGLADNTVVPFPGLVTVCDTFQFTTAIGSLRTVYVVRRATTHEMDITPISPVNPLTGK